MQDSTTKQRIAVKFHDLAGLMDERMSRQWAAAEASAYGWGGVRAVSEAIGMSPHTIRKGSTELAGREANPDIPIPPRIRRPGGGRKRCTESDPELSAALELVVDPVTRGDPMSPLRWTCKSTTRLAEELTRQGHPASPSTVGRLLKAAGYSLQSNRKTKEGGGHPDRNAQFEHINAMVKAFQENGQPVISVDTKKKELVGEFKNGGREWQPSGHPQEVLVHDFMDKELGKAIPYGVYDVTGNQGWVSVGIDHDTARFAAEAIRRWWKKMGSRRYRGADRLLITADGGGSNGSRCRLWKVALQELARGLGIPLHVCHFPPGTSKWNKIEHRMFCHITQNWRGRPLVSHEVIINLIANTATDRGLTIQAELDPGSYPTGIKVTDEQLAAVNITPNAFHGEWNYSILPGKREK
ncbi:ISAzo13 family transposase [Aquisphaera giovannonii]|uniref:ISAzo13 family transposase n=1 Tax=Aquisphaera giovannonii TaxID=406548 RepID=UPI0011DF2322|nr:ISAzo13 family transposase [Aquisphaera giovannonii]